MTVHESPRPGAPAPLGAERRGKCVHFAVYAPQAERVTLGLFAPNTTVPLRQHLLSAPVHRTGDVWHAEVADVDAGLTWAWRVERNGAQTAWLLDPMAQAVDGEGHFGPLPGAHTFARRGLIDVPAFDWAGDRAPATPWHDTVIYELHVRGYTRDPSANSRAPGTYVGLIEKIPWLRDLGVTAVELLPVFEFEEDLNRRRHPLSGAPLLNLWGYDPLTFFAPNAGYAHGARAGAAVVEFRELVRALHAAGIEVILDVVYNHTGEGGPDGPTLAWRGLAEGTYYHRNADGTYRDYSGCGNSVNANDPVVVDLIVASLRHWVEACHVDGFRFDLASVLTRGPDGAPLASPPLIERISADPVLRDTKLIAEAWDAVGLHQVGRFPGGTRFADWNDKCRDTLRRFVRGDGDQTAALADVLAGSERLYAGSGRTPAHSVNFVTCHDGFTLHDLVTYSVKNNRDNGEDNRDGAGENLSWNCGAEGPVSDPHVRALRARQTRNLLTLLLLASGTPMLLGGDEFGRTQRGNNNAYCQDNPIGWVDWRLAPAHAPLTRFVQTLLRLRRRYPQLRRRQFARAGGEPRIVWHGIDLNAPDWAAHSHSLAMEVVSADGRVSLYLAANGWWEPLEFEVPDRSPHWRIVVNTQAAPPRDCADPAQALEFAGDGRLALAPRSVAVLLADRSL